MQCPGNSLQLSMGSISSNNFATLSKTISKWPLCVIPPSLLTHPWLINMYPRCYHHFLCRMYHPESVLWEDSEEEGVWGAFFECYAGAGDTCLRIGDVQQYYTSSSPLSIHLWCTSCRWLWLLSPVNQYALQAGEDILSVVPPPNIVGRVQCGLTCMLHACVPEDIPDMRGMRGGLPVGVWNVFCFWFDRHGFIGYWNAVQLYAMPHAMTYLLWITYGLGRASWPVSVSAPCF